MHERTESRQHQALRLIALGVTFTLITPTALADTEYEYDALGRLTKVIYDDTSYVEYEYDATNNRKTVTSLSNQTTTPTADHYISPTGAYSNSGTAQSPWNLQRAAEEAAPGDIFELAGGTYAQTVDLQASGTSGSRITFRAATGETPLVTGASASDTPILISGDYITLEGISIKKTTVGQGKLFNILVTGNHNEIRNCSIIGTDAKADRDAGASESGIRVQKPSHNTLIEGCEIANLSHAGVHVQDGATRIIIRNNVIHGHYLDAVRFDHSFGLLREGLIEGNLLYGSLSSDGIQFNADFFSPDYPNDMSNCGTVIRNNIIYGNAENGIDLKGTCRILIEGNHVFGNRGDNDGPYAVPENCGASEEDRCGGAAIMRGKRPSSRDVVIRNNVVYDSKAGIVIGGDGWVVYNNTIVGNNRDYTGPNSAFVATDKPHFSGVALRSSAFDNVAVKNNIIGNHFDTEVNFGGSSVKADIDGNLYFNTSNPEFSYLSNPWTALTFTNWASTISGWSGISGDEANSFVAASPLFVSVPDFPTMGNSYDFSLTSSSPAINAGVSLTHTTGSGSGTQVSVQSARYFSEGMNIVAGDLIRIEGTGTDVTVVGVDYAQNQLTIDQSVSWTNGAGVSLAYSGAAPDIGAYEFGGSPSNGPPSFTGQACAQNATEGVQYSCTVSATDPNGDQLTYSLSSANTCGFLSIASTTGFIWGTPTSADLGNCTLGYQVTDGQFITSGTRSVIVSASGGGSVGATATLDIYQTAYGRFDFTLTNNSSSTAAITQAVLNVSGTEFDAIDTSGTLTLTPSSLGSNNNVRSVTGTITFSSGLAPGASAIGDAGDLDPYASPTALDMTVTFANGSTLSGDFVQNGDIWTWNETGGSNAPPTITGNDCASTATENVAYSCTVFASDPDGDTLVYSFGTGNTCDFLSINSSTGAISGTPSSGDTGGCTLATQVADSQFTDSDSEMLFVDPASNGAVAATAVLDIYHAEFGRFDLTLTNDPTSAASITQAVLNVSGTEFDAIDTSGTLTLTPSSLGSNNNVRSTTGTITFSPGLAPGAIALGDAGDLDPYATPTALDMSVTFSEGTTLTGPFQQDGQEWTWGESGVSSGGNQAPDATHNCSSSAAAGSAYSCSITATDDDGDTLTYSLGSGNTCTFLSIGGSTGAKRWSRSLGHRDKCRLCPEAGEPSDGAK